MRTRMQFLLTSHFFSSQLKDFGFYCQSKTRTPLYPTLIVLFLDNKDSIDIIEELSKCTQVFRISDEPIQ